MPLSALLLLSVFTLHGLAGQAQTASEYQVKAAYIYNFAKSAEWPERSLASGSSPLVIGVVAGDDEFIETLARMVGGRKIGSHPVMVKRVSSVEEMDFCHVIFFRSTSGHKRTQAASSALASASILLVGEEEDFLRQGGMINLIFREGKIRFEIDKGSLDRANIRLSPELMALADADHGSSSGPISSRNPAAPGGPAGAGNSEGSGNSTATGPERRLKVGVQPEYPEIAQHLNIKGVVQLELLVARDGSVKDVRIIGGHPVLTEALVKVVKGWQYEPAAKESRVIVRFVFGQ